MDRRTINTSEVKKGIHLVTLNRPDSRNALSILMRREIIEALAALACTKKYLVGNTQKGFEESFVIEHDETFRRFLLKNE